MPANDNPNYLAADVANVLADIDNLLTAYPELAEDDELRADMLEGSTQAYDVLTRLVNIERDADSMGKAIASRIADLQSRRKRADKRKEAMRALMLRVMKQCQIQKAPLVEATVSVLKGRDSVDVYDESSVPDAFVKVVRTPDKKAIGEALKIGVVSGARMKAGEDTITVRAA